MSSLGIRCWKKWCKAQGALEMVYLLMSPNFNLSILVESSLFISSCTAKEHGCTNTIKASIACWSARCPFCLCSVYPFAEPKRGRRRRKAQWNDCKYQYSPVSQMKCPSCLLFAHLQTAELINELFLKIKDGSWLQSCRWIPSSTAGWRCDDQ